MAFRSRTRPRLFLDFDQFEPRLALSASPASLTIPLDPTFDQFGSQIETIQAYGDPAQATFGIFDTGASVVTVSAEDRSAAGRQRRFDPGEGPRRALADGIGGDVIGDVSALGHDLGRRHPCLEPHIRRLGLPHVPRSLLRAR